MLYNVIMVQLDIDDPSTQRLEAAWQLAEAFEADLIGFCACNILTPAPVDGDGGFEARFFAQQTDDIKRHLEDVRNRFDEVTGESGRASWRGLIGDPTGALAKHARAADLVISGRPWNGDQASGLRSVDPGSLVLSAGRPVLLLSADKPSISLNRILAGWKDTREARRAISDALPLLKLASDVLLTAVEDGDRQETAESAADVVRFLMKHGVKVRSEVLSSSRNVGDALLETAEAMQADLVVAGGFGHSRLREWIFGGVTKTLIETDSIHRMLSN